MRATLVVSVRRVGLAAAVVLANAGALAAQLPNASAAATAMGGNFTAIARGYEAVTWNPANLAMPGRPLISFGLGMLGGSTGLAPVDFTTLHKFSGIDVDSATKVDWINQARLAGGQTARIDANLVPVALTFGPVGIQLGTSVYTSLNLSPDAFEAVLFGNAGNNGGQPKTLDFTGTRIRAGVINSGAVSFALPIPINLTNGALANEKAAIGITGKYSLGSGLIVAEDLGSSFGGSEIRLRFPMIAPDSNFDGRIGEGAGADVALSWSGGPWRIGVLAENVYNAFAWDTTKLAYSPGTGTFNTTGDSSVTDFDQQSYSAAPQELRDIVSKQRFKPAIAVGAALKVGGKLTLTADMKTYTGGDEAIVFGPKSHFGVGAEWRVLPFLPLRGGVASVTDGWQAGAGFGLRLLGYELGVATTIRRRGTASESGIMLGVVGIGH
jgi:hypothetical protein